MTTTTYGVTGLTCGHCVNAVTEELARLSGVGEVSVELVVDGISAVTVTSAGPLPEKEIATALDEAGDYRLAAAS